MCSTAHFQHSWEHPGFDYRQKQTLQSNERKKLWKLKGKIEKEIRTYLIGKGARRVEVTEVADESEERSLVSVINNEGPRGVTEDLERERKRRQIRCQKVGC